MRTGRRVIAAGGALCSAAGTWNSSGRYLDHHRPVLLRGERGTKPAEIDALWVSEVGTQLELGALAIRIRMHTHRAFGVSLPPHWFREAAATSIAVEDPKHVADARHVLGHASLATTERFYNQAAAS